MKVDFANWRDGLWMAALALAALLCGYHLASRALARRRQKKRIAAARRRSGHAPLDMPTTRGDLGDLGTSWATLGPKDVDPLVVDEQPSMRIRYTDPYGKLVERTIEVERLDLHRRAIVACGNSLYDPRIFPLDSIVEARNVQTGRPFNLGAWVEAVRVAKRRRDAHADLSSSSQWG